MAAAAKKLTLAVLGVPTNFDTRVFLPQMKTLDPSSRTAAAAVGRLECGCY